MNLVELDDEDQEQPDPVYDEYAEDEEEIDIHPAQGESLMLRRVMTTTSQDDKEDWRRKSIFRTRVKCEDKVCNAIIDGGSTENYVSKETVKKLKLPIEKHPHPYKIQWVKKGFEIPVKFQCLVRFTMGNDVDDEALCHVVQMDACHILLGRPWLFDHDMQHSTKENTYSFHRGGRKYTLHP